MKEKIKGNKIYQCAFAAFIVIAASILFYFMIFRIKEILGILSFILLTKSRYPSLVYLDLCLLIY